MVRYYSSLPNTKWDSRLSRSRSNDNDRLWWIRSEYGDASVKESKQNTIYLTNKKTAQKINNFRFTKFLPRSLYYVTDTNKVTTNTSFIWFICSIWRTFRTSNFIKLIELKPKYHQHKNVKTILKVKKIKFI